MSASGPSGHLVVIYQLQRSKKTCHKVSVIHVTQPKICPIQIVVSDIADQVVTTYS